MKRGRKHENKQKFKENHHCSHHRRRMCGIVLSVYIRNKQKVQIAVMDSMSQTSGDKGNTVTYEAGTEEFQKIREILADYQYHHTIKSFINNPQLSGDPDEFIMLVMENDSLILTNGGEILINGRLYRIGYGDGARAQKMIDEIKAVME